jgi:hypothetical protein
MNVYHLGKPRYESEESEELFNPIHAIRDYWLPGMICPRCGAWAANRRPYLPVQSKQIREQLRQPLPVDRVKWLSLAQGVRDQLGLPVDFVLMPGDVLGPAKLEVTGPIIADVMHVFPGHIVVTAKVVSALESAKITGYAPIPLEQVTLEPHMKNSYSELFELRVTGRIWLQEPAGKDICPVCGRLQRFDYNWFASDQLVWDGSDVFLFEGNPNMVLVTDTIRSLFSAHNFSNYACEPVKIDLPDFSSGD